MEQVHRALLSWGCAPCSVGWRERWIMCPVPDNQNAEKYFFDARTMDDLCGVLEPFRRPCLLCAPMLGREWHERGRTATVLDIDARFSDLPGFVRWDLKRPAFQDGGFDVIVCDPPSVGVSLSHLVGAVRMLSEFGERMPLAVSYLTRRESALLGAFAGMGVAPTGYYPAYRATANPERNEIQLYANFDSPLWSTVSAPAA